MRIYDPNDPMTIDDVPKLWRKKVQNAIDKGLYKPGHVDGIGEADAEA